MINNVHQHFELEVVALQPKTCKSCGVEKIKLDFPRPHTGKECRVCLNNKHRQRQVKGPSTTTDYFGRPNKKNKAVKVTWFD